MNYWEIIESSYTSAAKGLWNKIVDPFTSSGYLNLFYFLILISVLIWVLEIALPWRKKQAIFRRDFWLDSFYMFFNFFLFRVLIFAALVRVTFLLFVSFLELFGYKGGALIDLSDLHWGIQFVVFFLVADIAQWGVHVLLHRVPFLWKFHKVHHSVKEMGFAAHLRYHFMENVFYQPAKFVALSLVFGFDLEYIFYVYYSTTLIGHLNHANLNMDYGPLRFVFNNPKMHIWHHSKELPEKHPYGMNFGISLSVWDYLFGTAYVPYDGRDIELGFPEDEEYPQGFFGQLIEPFKRKR
ncbi:MAG: sterol desaturase family protein [Crocinitomicaceae bacterium]